jgi:hypothetical protein
MNEMLAPDQIDMLRAYAGGKLGTRETIERAGLDDYADLIIAMARNNLDFPKPAETPEHEAHVARAREILQPRLRHGR